MSFAFTCFSNVNFLTSLLLDDDEDARLAASRFWANSLCLYLSASSCSLNYLSASLSLSYYSNNSLCAFSAASLSLYISLSISYRLTLSASLSLSYSIYRCLSFSAYLSLASCSSCLYWAKSCSTSLRLAAASSLSLSASSRRCLSSLFLSSSHYSLSLWRLASASYSRRSISRRIYSACCCSCSACLLFSSCLICSYSR